MEEYNPQTSSSMETTSEGSKDNEVEDPSRREFLKAAGMLTLGALLASCAPKKMLEGAEEQINMDENVKNLNFQFQERVNDFINEEGALDYERYSKLYPEFDQYVEGIELHSTDISKMYHIHPAVMKVLASSILVANVGREDNMNVDVNDRRTGIMGLVPSEVLPVVNKAFDDTFTIEELQIPDNSIYFSMLYMAERLKSIRSNREDNNLMEMMLADYYGGTSLQDIVKGKSSIDNNQVLKSAYDLYKKTESVLNRGSKTSTEDISEVFVERDVQEVLNRAVEMWPESKFGEFRNVFFNQVNEYHKKALQFNPNITKSELLAVFLSVARAESKGGIYKEILHKDPNIPENRYAVGWYQIVPKWEHLERFNTATGKNYTYKDMVTNDVASIEAGIWTLMQYSHAMDIVELMKKFKGGWSFGEDLQKQPDDPLWWNRVAYGIKSLLRYDPFNMKYLTYLAPREVKNQKGEVIKVVWDGPFEGTRFEELGHIGVMAPDTKKES